MIGLGEIAFSTTGAQIQKTATTEMVAGADPVAHVAESYQARYEIPCSTRVEDVLENPEVDAVIISTPHYLHVPLGIQAARAGKHVIVEKPMATTVEDADALIAACREAGVLCSAKETATRYQAATAKARELVAQGAIGDVMATQIYGVSNKPDPYWTGGYTGRVQTKWRKSKLESGGGILIMNFIYDIYRLRYVTGLEIARVFCEFDTYRTPVEVEDFITLTLRYTNGALGTLTASSCVPGSSRSGIRGTQASGNRIFGTAGQLVFEEGGLLVYTTRELAGLSVNDWTSITFPRELPDPYVVYFEHFANVALNGGVLDVPAEEGRRDLEVIAAAYQSGVTHQPVLLG